MVHCPRLLPEQAQSRSPSYESTLLPLWKRDITRLRGLELRLGVLLVLLAAAGTSETDTTEPRSSGSHRLVTRQLCRARIGRFPNTYIAHTDLVHLLMHLEVVR